MNAGGRAAEADRPRTDELAEAFAWFAQTTERLQTSHRELRGLARALGDELAAKNAELEASLADRERAERFLSALLERLTNGVVVLDAEGAVVLANPKAEQLLGRSAGDLRGGGLAPEIARIAD
ncbi:MAG: PAS domain-containing protein, partial [Candidatus Methylomirabilis sp.]|nr:PAS domain-containing protein [Deltaproteobacteria bacterium]